MDKPEIKIVVMDLDGTFTNNTITVDFEGNKSRSYNTADFLGLNLLHESYPDVKIVLLTSSFEKDIIERFKWAAFVKQYLGVDLNSKFKILNSILEEEKISLQEVAYIGNDVNDFHCLSEVGFAACPKDAEEEIKEIEGIYITKRKGGQGAVRDFCNYLMKYYL